MIGGITINGRGQYDSYIFRAGRYNLTDEELKKLSDEKLHKLNVELSIAENVYWTVYGKQSRAISHLGFLISNEEWSRHYGNYRHPISGKGHTCYHREAYYI